MSKDKRMSYLEIKKITKIYNKQTVLNEISANVEKGELVWHKKKS